MKTIRIPTSKPEWGSGCSGTYYRLTKDIGVKVVDMLDEARDEADKLKLVNKKFPGLFPKYYGIVRIKGTGEFGIVMEHIRGRTFDEADIGERSKYRAIADATMERLVKKGLDWQDNHDGNIILSVDRQVRFVDAAGIHYR